MKLNYKRTIFVGFAFFLISAFWQAYDTTIPLILTNKFGLSQTASGGIMALDNVLALFLLPLFGALSDRCNRKMGKRTPFILIGTITAVVLFISLSFADNMQREHIAHISEIDDPVALQTIYESEADSPLQPPDGEEYVLSEQFSKAEFCSIPSMIFHKDGIIYSENGETYPLADQFNEDELKDIRRHDEGASFTNPHYTDYVVPARQACAWKTTSNDPSALILFIVLLFLILLAMATFRSPSVALMPDVTIKPLRSKANAIINLMGSAGGILVLVLGRLFATSSVKNSLMSYTPFFCVISFAMLLALGLFMWQVREPKFAREMQEDSKKYGIDETVAEETGGKLGKGERRSMFFLLASIVLWFMGYNAVTSKYSVYASNILNKDYNLTLIIAQAAAIISYLPIGFISSKFGRKKTILAGVVMLTTSFTVASFLRESSSTLLMNAMFVLAGIGWATINVNSFPMVVEMCQGGSVGKYTGIYYTASMAAQTVTPLFSGYLMDSLGMTTLFPYASVFAGLAFITMLFVRHGDNKPTAKAGLEALDIED